MVVTTPKCRSNGGIKSATRMRVFKGACEYFVKNGIDRFDAERYAFACVRQLERGERISSGDCEATANFILSRANLEYIMQATGEVL